MLTKKFLQYPYIFLLAISFFVVAGAWKLGCIDLKKDATALSSEAILPSEETSPDFDNPPVTAEPEITETAMNESPREDSGEKSTSPNFFEADRSYFDDALFIGDSRTVGLYEYGDLGNAIVLADSGMSVYKVFKQSFRLDSGEELTLEEILTQKQFGKIYVMLGINELGYSFEQTVNVYKDMIEHIEAMQPDALIFLQANLHITEKKSQSSPIYNNANIDRFNYEVQQMTDSMKCFFLDANELFDDENGNLSVEYTVDESHVLGKYYADWVDWILCHAVAVNDK